MAEEAEKQDGKKSTFSKARLFIGIYLMSALCAVPYSWGTLNVYTVSYFHFRVNIDTGSASSWVIALNSMSWGMAILLGAYISRWFGFRLTMVGSLFVFTLAMSLCYFAVQTSFVLLNLFVGVMCGFTFGISQCLEVNLITSWTASKRMGLAICCVMLTQHLGNIVLSVILTTYVNPLNIPPDAIESKIQIFSQSEILDKVPSMFLLYACIAFGCGVVATGLVWTSTPSGATCGRRKHGTDNNKNIEKESDGFSKKCQSYSSIIEPDELTQHARVSESGKYERTSAKEGNKSDSKLYKNENGGKFDTEKAIKANDKPNQSALSSLEADQDTIIVPVDTNNGHSDSKSCDKGILLSEFSPKQVFKRKTFYAMVVMVAYADVSCTILNTFYKMFGLVHYPDDEFFTRMGIGMNVGAVLATWLTGIASDTFQVKNVIIANTAIICIVSALFYPSALISKWFYLVLGVIFNGSTLSVYVLVIVCASRYFGKEVTTVVQGMALSSMYVTNFVIPVTADSILSTFGWLHLFMFVSGFNVIGLIVVVLAIEPENTIAKTEPHENKTVVE